MTISSVQRHLSAMRPHLDFVRGFVRDKLASYCDGLGFPQIGRVKTELSIADKIETGRMESWSDIDDLVAFAVIVPSLESEATVLSFLRSEFEEVLTKGRGGASKSPDVFRFDATRFIGRLRPGIAGEREDSPANKVKFEVQIRTAFEHAWSVATHSLVYKPDQVDWKRLRLAAHLKAAVEQLDALVVAFDDVAPHFAISNWPEVEARVKVVEMVAALIGDGKVEETSRPQSVGRFSESFVGLVKASGRLRPEQVVSQSEVAIGHVRAFAGSGEKCPRRFSLYQWSIGILSNAGFLSKIRDDFVLPVDDELVSEFPSLAAFKRRFVWD